MRPAERAVAGALSLVLLTGVGYLLTRIALGAWTDDYRVNVVLGDLGEGVIAGTDVKMRGVLVGSVGGITLDDDLQAVAELVLQPQHRIPERATYAVTGKTLLGEKQVEIRFDGPHDQGPFLAEGVTVDDADRVVELQDVLADLTELLGAVDTDDVATLVDEGFGAFDGQGPQIARSVEQGARAARLGVRTLDDAIPSLHDLSLVAERLATTGSEFNRMAAEVNAGLPTLSDNQAGTRRVLDELSRFATTLDATLTVDRPSIDRLIVRGDSVTRMLAAYAPEVGEIVNGLFLYTEKFAAGGYTSEGHTGQAARFQILADAHLVESLCEGLPPEFSQAIPACGAGAARAPTGAGGVPAPAQTPLLELPVRPDLLAPEVPQRLGVDALLRGVLPGAAGSSGLPAGDVGGGR